MTASADAASDEARNFRRSMKSSHASLTIPGSLFCPASSHNSNRVSMAGISGWRLSFEKYDSSGLGDRYFYNAETICGFTSVRADWHNGGTTQWAAASNRREHTERKTGDSRRRRRSQDEAAARAASRRGRFLGSLRGGRGDRAAAAS